MSKEAAWTTSKFPRASLTSKGSQQGGGSHQPVFLSLNQISIFPAGYISVTKNKHETSDSTQPSYHGKYCSFTGLGIPINI